MDALVSRWASRLRFFVPGLAVGLGGACEGSARECESDGSSLAHVVEWETMSAEDAIPGAYESDAPIVPTIPYASSFPPSCALYSLPHELLAHILALSSPPPGTPASARRWLALSRISPRLRAVVLALAPVWAAHVLALPHPAFRAAALARAHGAPLSGSLRVAHPRPFHDAGLHFLRAHLPRMRALDLDLPERALAHFGAILAAAPPLDTLTDLRLALSSPSPGARIASFRRLPRLAAPRLTHATFRDALLFLSPATPTPHLQTLDIENASAYRAEPDGMLLDEAELLSVLARAPALRTLRLAHAVPRIGPGPRIRLAHLEALELVCAPARTAALLERLDLPAHTRIFVAAKHGGAPTDEVDADAVRRLLDALRAPRTAIALDVYSAAHLTVSRAPQRSTADASSSSIALSLALCAPLLASCAVLAPARTHTLVLREDPLNVCAGPAAARAVCAALEALLIPDGKDAVLGELRALVVGGRAEVYAERVRVLAARRAEMGLRIERVVVGCEGQTVEIEV
ncbi:hypothetical protein K488DRAFT_89611 [Vararia minispora EC-137]|uniref:Uncharacterized protein n=1 Tax=Vararia minispora EC-137 TaxID=1314806 RepID=A0ACB8QAG2_9AGAM|nr:hypothetical protein K488DRAFT_89611 [Vararia minispora EC-137]